MHSGRVSSKEDEASFERRATEDELIMLHAELKHWDIIKQSQRMEDEQLRTRSAEKRALLKRREAKELLEGIELSHVWWAQSLATLALRKVELLGDLRWIEAQGPACESTEIHVHTTRQSRQQERIKDWEKVAAMAEIRIEMKLMDTILADRVKVEHIRCDECRVYKNPNDFRRAKNKHITTRCFECVNFPIAEFASASVQRPKGPCS
jgi:hypothetical protein